MCCAMLKRATRYRVEAVRRPRRHEARGARLEDADLLNLSLRLAVWCKGHMRLIRGVSGGAVVIKLESGSALGGSGNTLKLIRYTWNLFRYNCRWGG